MNKYHTVKSSRDFTKIIKNSPYVKNKAFVIYYAKNDIDIYRFGISVSKKIGNAVCRNRIKRQVRNINDKYKKYYQNGLDYIIIIRNSYVDLNFNEVDEKYFDLIKNINRNIRKGESHEEDK